MLISQEKSPNVTMFTGRNNIFRNGRTMTERKVNTIPETIKIVVLEKETAGKAFERINKPMVVNAIVRIMDFMIVSLYQFFLFFFYIHFPQLALSA